MIPLILVFLGAVLLAVGLFIPNPARLAAVGATLMAVGYGIQLLQGASL